MKISKERNTRCLTVIGFLFVFFSSQVSAQTLDSLMKQVYRLNDNGHYVESVKRINAFLDEHKTTADHCNTQLLMADTYKRLFDYDQVFHYFKIYETLNIQSDKSGTASL